MTKLLIVTAAISMISSVALAQSTPTGAGQQVNPGNNPERGERSTFGMNNGGDAATGTGLRGGKTADTYEWLKKKQSVTDEANRKK